MNIIYKSVAFTAVALALASCSKHDMFDDNFQLGDAVPTVYWEVGSSACKAGDEFTFKGTYYTEKGATPDHSEVWYSVTRAESAAATVKLAGSLSYTQTEAKTDVVRPTIPVVSFPHSMAEFDAANNQFVLNATVGTSSTLSPVDWVNPKEWDQEKFQSYYPAGFDPEFCDKVVEYLTKDSTYYSSLRTVYINYPFTNEQFAEANNVCGTNLPTNIGEEEGSDISAEKSDLWYATTEADPAKIVGYYYTTIDGDGRTIIHEVAKDYVNPDVNLWPVYDSAPWVFCRYNDDTGSIISTVRANYMPAFKYLISKISFPEWIYDSANQNYAVTFGRTYSLEAQFRVYDTAGNEGIASDIRTISIN